MKSKKTKRALVSSALALVLCFVMLLGTTFAWFTDNASTSVNKVQAGTLDVALEMKENGDWVSAEGKELKFLQATETEGVSKYVASEDLLWEPGCIFELPELRVVNNGNLALQYKVFFTALNGDSALAKVLDVEVEGENSVWKKECTLADALNADFDTFMDGKLTSKDDAEAIHVRLHMQETAGNAYQGKSISSIAVTVYATQYTYEYDSNDNQYDKNAEYLIPWDGESTTTLTKDAQDGKYHIHSAEELAAFAASVNNGTESYQGKTVVLDNNIDLNNVAWTPIGKVAQDQNNQNNQDNKYFMGTFDGQGHTIYNLYVDKTDTADELIYTTAGLFGWVDAGGCTIQNVNIDGATVKGNHYTGALVGYFSGKIENCSVTNSTVVSVNHDDDNNGDKAGGLVGYMNKNASVKNSSVTNSSIFANRDAGGLVGCACGSSCTVSGNSVSNTTVYTTGANCGAIVGRPYGSDSSDTCDVSNNTDTNVTAMAQSTVTYVAPGVTQDGDTYLISSADGLLYCATTFNTGAMTSGKEFKLTADIDMSGKTWEPWCNEAQYFNGTFDGQNHTISNLTITDTYTDGSGHAVGFIGRLGSNGTGTNTLTNVTFDKANVSGYHYVGVAVGYNEFGKVENVKVINSTVTCTHVAGADSCGDKAGALIGMCGPNSGYVSVTTCSATNCTVTAARDAAQLIGYGYANNTYTNLSATSVTVTADKGDCKHERAGRVYNGLVGNGGESGLTIN